MRKGMLAFMLVFVSGYASAAADYDVAVTIQDNKTVLKFPTLQLSNGDWGTTKTGNCQYKGRLTKQDDANLLLEGSVACVSEEGESYYDTPIFVLTPEGGKVSAKIGEEGDVIWKYSVAVSILNRL